MPLMDENKLRETALQQCRETMSDLVEGDLYCVPEAHDCEWDPLLKRHVFTQSITVWRNFDTIEMTVTPDGRIVAFRDQHRFREARYEPLDDGEILAITRTTGLLGASARVEKKDATPEGMLTAVVTQNEIDKPARIVFTINPTLRQVAAFTVTQG
jgi:hypothetical protein